MQVEVKGALYAFAYEGTCDLRKLYFYASEYKAPWVKVCDHIIRIEVDENFDWRTPTVEGLEAKKAELRGKLGKELLLSRHSFFIR